MSERTLNIVQEDLYAHDMMGFDAISYSIFSTFLFSDVFGLRANYLANFPFIRVRVVHVYRWMCVYIHPLSPPFTLSLCGKRLVLL